MPQARRNRARRARASVRAPASCVLDGEAPLPLGTPNVTPPALLARAQRSVAGLRDLRLCLRCLAGGSVECRSSSRGGSRLVLVRGLKMAGSRDFKYLYEWCEATPASEDLANVVLARVTHHPLPNPPRTYAGQLAHVVGSLPEEEHGFTGLLPDTHGDAASRLLVELSLKQHVNNVKV